MLTRAGFLRALEEILGADARSLKDEDSRGTIAQWTSLADVQIFTLITDEFGIEPDQKLIDAETIGDLVAVLEGRGAFDA